MARRTKKNPTREVGITIFTPVGFEQKMATPTTCAVLGVTRDLADVSSWRASVFHFGSKLTARAKDARDVTGITLRLHISRPASKAMDGSVHGEVCLSRSCRPSHVLPPLRIEMLASTLYYDSASKLAARRLAFTTVRYGIHVCYCST